MHSIVFKRVHHLIKLLIRFYEKEFLLALIHMPIDNRVVAPFLDGDATFDSKFFSQPRARIRSGLTLHVDLDHR